MSCPEDYSSRNFTEYFIAMVIAVADLLSGSATESLLMFTDGFSTSFSE